MNKKRDTKPFSGAALFKVFSHLGRGPFLGGVAKLAEISPNLFSARFSEKKIINFVASESF